jgi:hypothetical protein
MTETYGTFAERDTRTDQEDVTEDDEMEQQHEAGFEEDAESNGEEQIFDIGKGRKFLRSISRNSVQSGKDDDFQQPKERSTIHNRPEEPLESSRTRHSSQSNLSNRVVGHPPSGKDDFVRRMREMLRKVFQFYASFGNRCNSRYLKPSQFIKMMLDSDIVDGQLNQTKLDILFLQACKRSKTLEFEDFLELLFMVAAKKFKKEANSDKALSLLLTKFIEPLFKRIMNETDAGIEEKILNVPLSVSTLLLLRMINKPLQSIYKHFFSWEVNRPLQEKPSMAKVESELFLFLKEFEVCPQLVAKASAHSIYTQVLNTNAADLCKNSQYPDLEKILGRDLGEMFTYFRFVIYLTRLGIFIFSDLNNVPSTHKNIEFTDEEKVYLLFERLDISSGITKVMQSLLKDKSVVSSSTHHKLSLTKESLMHIHKETNSYPHFFPETEEVQPENQLSRILKTNLDQRRNSKVGQTQDEEFMYIKLARQSSKSKLSPRNKSTSLSLSRKPKRTLLVNNKANKENLADLSNKDASQGGSDDTGPNLIMPESYDICEMYLDELHRIFECYCSFGDPGNFTLMKSSRFFKLMKEVEVVDTKDSNALATQDVDVIFFSVLHGLNPFSTQSRKRARDIMLKFNSENNNSRNTSPMKGKSVLKGLNFSMFLQCLEAVALLTEKELAKEDRFRSFLNKRVLTLARSRLAVNSQSGSAASIKQKIDDNEQFTAKLMAVLRDRQMIDILATVHKTMLPIYQLYCDDSKLITAKKYIQFMKDFGVFPQVISQVKLLQLFHELCSLYKSKSGIHEAKEAAIDQHLFVEGLALVALEVEYDKFKLTHCQKLILLLERMNDSEATQKLSRYLGRTISKKFDIVSQIRLKFADQFKF